MDTADKIVMVLFVFSPIFVFALVFLIMLPFLPRKEDDD
jgi:hypothetical protein